jgi:hypothetical protein
MESFVAGLLRAAAHAGREQTSFSKGSLLNGTNFDFLGDAE